MAILAIGFTYYKSQPCNSQLEPPQKAGNLSKCEKHKENVAWIEHDRTQVICMNILLLIFLICNDTPMTTGSWIHTYPVPKNILVMVLPTLPSIPWVTMGIPTSSCSSCEAWSFFSFTSSRGLVRMRDPHRLRWGKERGPAGSFSSPDQLGARSDKYIGKTPDVTRLSQTCNAKKPIGWTLLAALQSYKYHLSKNVWCRQSKISKCFYVHLCVVQYSVGLCFNMFKTISHVYFLL